MSYNTYIMNIQTNISFRDLTTIKLGGNAKYFAEVTSVDEIAEACRFAKSKSLPIYVIGGGSNVIARDSGYHGIVIRNAIKGFKILENDETSTTILVGAGEKWDSVVEKSVAINLSGIEAMSAIPGTAGATPVQNVGAYGQEISDTLQSIEAYDTKTDKLVALKKSACNLSYRYSIFKDEFAGRYIITSITLKLLKKRMIPPFYDSLQKYLDERNITDYSPKIIREAVIAIRKEKLPDPKQLPNCGSFFKNAVVSAEKLAEIKSKHPDVLAFPIENGQYKIPSGWLIEHSGLKGKLMNGIRVYDKNAMILTNESAVSYDDLVKAKNEITKEVSDKFGVEIQQEPIII